MKSNGANIVIIGGGYTGLTAALRLAETGHKVTIIERGDSLGGLASGFTIEGEPLERAYHHIFKTDTDIIGLAEELGVAKQLKWHDSSVALYFNGRLFPFKGVLDLLRFTPLTLINRIRAGLVVLYLQKTNNWHKFEKVSAYEWMLRVAGKQVTAVIWEPLLMGKFDKYYNRVSMAWLWARIHVRAQSREAGGEKLGYFDGGFQVFTDALIAKLHQLDVEINTGVEIDSITSKSGKVTISIKGKKDFHYDACIATTPSYVFSKLISGDKSASPKYLKQLENISYLGARLFVFSSTQNISQYYWHNINDVNLPFLVFINHTKLVNKRKYGNKYVYYVATYVPHDHMLFACSDKELEAIWVKGINEVFPHFDKTKIREKYFFRFANAQHVVEKNYSNHIPSYKSPLKNVYLANFSQIYPEDRGTNYAVREGIKIASLVTKNIK